MPNSKLSIRKRNGFGVNNYIYKTIEVTILPAWYSTIWFRILIAISLVFLVFFIVKFRAKALVRKSMEQDVLITERTYSLQLALNNLETAQKDLRRQMALYKRLFSAISHDIKTPLYFLAISNRELFNKLIVSKLDSSMVLLSKRNLDGVEQLLNMTNNLLDFIKLWSSDEILDFRHVNLFNIVETKRKIFESALSIKNIEFMNIVSENIIVSTHAGIIYIIVHNLLDNAIKATHNEVIVIRDFIDEYESLHLIIEDSGFGMNKKVLNFINGDRLDAGFYTDSEELESGGGIGLRIVKELAALINVEIYAELRKPIGTAVHISFLK